jgi:hypothetical protein
MDFLSGARFLGISQTVETRRAYRELIVTTPGLGESISGAILYDETIPQQKKDGTPFAKPLSDVGIIPGIKVDTDAKEMAGHPGEKITEGLDGLRDGSEQKMSRRVRIFEDREHGFGRLQGIAVLVDLLLRTRLSQHELLLYSFGSLLIAFDNSPTVWPYPKAT